MAQLCISWRALSLNRTTSSSASMLAAGVPSGPFDVTVTEKGMRPRIPCQVRAWMEILRMPRLTGWGTSNRSRQRLNVHIKQVFGERRTEGVSNLSLPDDRPPSDSSRNGYAWMDCANIFVLNDRYGLFGEESVRVQGDILSQVSIRRTRTE